jgi:D-3-phosphoglycerate dehydrogenase
MTEKYFIIDFDSTFTNCEALDVLGEISLDGRADRDERLKKIADITNLGMSGDISFAQSLIDRVDLLDAKKSHIEELISRLKKRVSVSTIRNKAFFENNADNIYIVSSGFKEFIAPVVADFGIAENHVFANKFAFNENDDIVGFDASIALSQDGGKVKLMKELNLSGDINVIGDGFTDYEIRQAGLANKFYAFTENVSREKVVKVADMVVTSFDEIIADNNL